MRGKVCMNARKDRYAGITPAYAGKSKKSGMDSIISQDHPRLCGEKQDVQQPQQMQQGSPPPMRGKDFYSKVQEVRTGITPAYAGKSPRRRSLLQSL